MEMACISVEKTVPFPNITPKNATGVLNDYLSDTVAENGGGSARQGPFCFNKEKETTASCSE